VTVTVTPGMALLLSSVTVPTIEPVLTVWADMPALNTSITAANANPAALLDITPPSQFLLWMHRVSQM
jgi:hypothetical protein